MKLRTGYDYVSWERLFPGYGVDLTALRYEPLDDCRAGVEAALKHLRLGRSPKPDRVSEIRGCLSEALVEAVDLKSSYAAVLFPKPKRSSDHLWMAFTAYENTTPGLRPTGTLRRDVVDPELGAARPFPCLTIRGTFSSGRNLFVIRSHASSEALAEMLDELVTAWAKGLGLPR